jgi:hypothetical protein
MGIRLAQQGARRLNMTITDPVFLTRAFSSGAFAHTTPPMPPMIDPALPGVGDPGKPPIGDPPGFPLEPDDPGQPMPRPEPPSTPIAPPGIPLPPAIT